MDPNKTTVILGAPGTGKTETLLTIVEKALASGVKPNKIGFISFTKKAADEGKTRASERFSLHPDDLPHFRTLHSMAFKHLGIRRDQMFSWQHKRELGKMLGIEFKGFSDNSEDDVYGMADADRMLFLEGLAKNTLQPLRKVWEDAFEDSVDWHELDRFAQTLTTFKKNRNLTDFNDLMVRFCESDPRTLPQLDLLLVDEVQDTSTLQWRAIEMLAAKAKQVYVCGDDCQSIYRFSGADVEQFINMPGKQITLDQSYRIPLSVHKLADSLSDRIHNKRPRFWKPRDEAGSVNWYNSVEEVDLSSGSWMLLARNNYMLRELEDYCLTQGFSFHSSSRDPLNSPALFAIRTWENLRKGQEESAERVLDVLKYIESRLVPAALMKKLKSDESSRMYAMPELVQLGLTKTDIWHQTLTRISPAERDFFIAARRRGESLLKKPRISVGTCHGSKGGEADHVLLLTDMSARCYSNMESNTDDEVRVFYVGATRARKTLNLISPKTSLYFDI